jgi:polysaccharide export outer membrane protein
MQVFRFICRLGFCVFATCGLQSFSQTASTPSTAPTTATQPAATNAGADTKSSAPIIPGLSNLPTSQSGPPSTPQNQQTVAPAGLQVSSGDLLDINVYGVPDLTQKVRVSNSGDGYFPLLGNIHLDGLTIEEAQAAIEKKLVDGGIMKNPHVSVFVSEYSSGVSMLGMIQKPGIYPLLGTRRLYDMISAAGGLAPGAGRLITITHHNDPMNPLTITLTSDPKLSAENNIEIKQGDTIEILKAGVVYVVGEVARASGLIMDSGQNLSVMKAVALSGGTTRVAALDSAKIIRKDEKGNPVEVPVQLKKMFQGKAPDVELVADDILFIPTSAGKNAALRSMETALQLVTGVTIRHF